MMMTMVTLITATIIPTVKPILETLEELLRGRENEVAEIGTIMPVVVEYVFNKLVVVVEAAVITVVVMAVVVVVVVVAVVVVVIMVEVEVVGETAMIGCHSLLFYTVKPIALPCMYIGCIYKHIT